MKRNKIYLAGKVTGMKWEEAYMNFYTAEMQNRHAGLTVNPMRICSKFWSWYRCMFVCLYHLILNCDRIHLQENWKQSRGAKIEVVIAIFFRKEFL